MKASLFMVLIIFFRISSCKNAYKKLLNKKLSSNKAHNNNFNLFQCFQNCEKKEDCKIFNYNANLKICQLADKEADETSNNIFDSNGWNTYFPTDRKSVVASFNDSTKRIMVEALKYGPTEVHKKLTFNYTSSLNLTICLWFKPNVTYVNNKALFTAFSIKPCFEIMLFITLDRKLLVLVNADGIIQEHYSEKKSSASLFYHVCIVFNEGSVVIYIDGVKDTTASFTNIPNNLVRLEYLRIAKSMSREKSCGLHHGDGFVEGFIYDFKIFEKSLTQMETFSVSNGNYETVSTVSWEFIKAGYQNSRLLTQVLLHKA